MARRANPSGAPATVTRNDSGSDWPARSARGPCCPHRNGVHRTSAHIEGRSTATSGLDTPDVQIKPPGNDPRSPPFRSSMEGFLHPGIACRRARQGCLFRLRRDVSRPALGACEVMAASPRAATGDRTGTRKPGRRNTRPSGAGARVGVGFPDSRHAGIGTFRLWSWLVVDWGDFRGLQLQVSVYWK